MSDYCHDCEQSKTPENIADEIYRINLARAKKYQQTQARIYGYSGTVYFTRAGNKVITSRERPDDYTEACFVG